MTTRRQKAVLVTGASSGLGAGLARAYGKDGAWVGLLGRDTERLGAVAQAVRSLGGRDWLRSVDVTDTAAMTQAVQDFASEAGALDVVIANAGVGESRGADRFDPTKVAEIIRVNAIGLTNTLLPAIPLIRAQGHGSLVGMASLAGYGALPGSLVYSASKSFVITFMRGLQLELAGTALHALALCPGFVRTPLTDKNHFPMPFLLECDEACLRMKGAIEQKKTRYSFPFPTAVGAGLLALLPPRAVLALLPPTPEPEPRA